MNSSGQASYGKSPDTSEEALVQLFQFVLILCVCSPVSFLGVLANSVNIAVLSRMNRRQTTTMVLLAMSVSDMLSSLGLFQTTVCYYPGWEKLKELPFIPDEIHVNTGSWMLVAFASVTAQLTFIILGERCLCVLSPIKVRNIATSGRIKALIIFAFFWGIASNALYLYTKEFVWKFSERWNKTMLGIAYIENGRDLEEPLMITSNVLSQYILYSGIVALTIVLVVALRRVRIWRQRQSRGQGQRGTNASTRREAKVAKAVCVISTIFLICYCPDAMNLTMMLVSPEYNFGAAHHDIFVLMTGATYALQAFNSFVNIIVYWNFNSQYRREFRNIFKYFQQRDQ